MPRSPAFEPALKPALKPAFDPAAQHASAGSGWIGRAGPAPFPLFADEVTPSTGTDTSTDLEPTDHRDRGAGRCGWGWPPCSWSSRPRDRCSPPTTTPPGRGRPGFQREQLAGQEAQPGQEVERRADPVGPVMSPATPPSTSRPPRRSGVDLEGNSVAYNANNMLDGVPETTWRMPGDGTGEELTITLPDETTAALGRADQRLRQDRQRAEGGESTGTTATAASSRSNGSSTTAPPCRRPSPTRPACRRSTSTSPRRRSCCGWSTCRPPGNGTAARDFTAISDLSLISSG